MDLQRVSIDLDCFCALATGGNVRILMETRAG
jgi:hypothetical protein